MEAFARFLSVLAIPLGIINIFGGIISGIWLAILGKWGLIGYGLLAIIVSDMGLGIAMMPGLIFAAPAAVLIEKGNKLGGYFFGLLSTVYAVGVLTGWCVLVLVCYTENVDANTLTPVLIWSYGIAIVPIAFLAEKELQSGNEFAMILTFFIQVAYILTILAILLVGLLLRDVLIIFGSVMSIGIVVQFSIAYLSDKL